MASVAGRVEQGPWVSMLPRMAVTGAMLLRVVRMLGSPMSPAWRMWSTLARAGRSSGRRRPWVSERTPMRALG